jgi:hypothetical protein
MRLDFVGLSFVLVMLSSAASAAIRPTFVLESSAWQATDIVSVVAMRQGGVFEVVESLKGGLAPGTNVTVPELVPAADALPI